MSSLLGQTQIVQRLTQEEYPQLVTKDIIRRAVHERDREAQHFIEVLQYTGLKRIYSKIQCFIEGDSYLNGTIGIPAVVPVYLTYIADVLTDKLVDNTQFYLVVPFNDRHLRTEAFIEYLDICRNWD